MKDMDVFALPSRSEGLSIALLEAMAEGVPVAVTDVGGSREVVEDGRAGWILSSDDSTWAGFLEHLASPVGRMESAERAAAGRRRVTSRYSLDRMIDEYEAVYARVAKTGVVHGGASS